MFLFKASQKQKPASKPVSKLKNSSGDQPASCFHATVVPAKPFTPVKDADAMRKAIGNNNILLKCILTVSACTVQG